MKLSPETLAILKNFSRTNTNLYVEKDTNIVVTCSPTKTVLCRADVPDVFPESFGIYDMNSFLGALSIFDDPNIGFSSSQCIITDAKDKRKRLSYNCAAKNVLSLPTVNSLAVLPTDVVAEFELTDESLKTIVRSASLMQLDQIVIAVDNDKASIGAKNAESGSGDVSNIFSIDISDQVSRGDAFSSLHESGYDKLNINPVQPADYKVTVTTKVMQMETKDFMGTAGCNVTYWFAQMKKSA